MTSNRISRFCVTVALSALMVGSFAQTKKAAPTDKKVVECPVCHMPLSAKKTKDNTVAVRLKKGGPVMYCCSKCKMPASVLVKKTTKTTHKKTTASKAKTVKVKG